MANEIFLLALAVLTAAVLAWGFRTLPQEGWQIAAAVPIAKVDSGHWQGLNLTYYGVFQATAYTAGVAITLVLLGAAGIPLLGTLAVTGLLLACCIPAASLVARLVERKRATFTVGGAVFVGTLAAPWLLLAANRWLGPWLGFSVPVASGMAALIVGYALGEGIGRLACVSFGCCYGKPVSQVSPRLRRLFARCCFVFAGPTKKIAYEGGLEGEPVVPIQGLTAAWFVTLAMIGTAVFLAGHHRLALGVAFVGTQVWRIGSEFLRADYRGGGHISAYQIMAGIGIAYVLATLPFLPAAPAGSIDILRGLESLWTPAVILCLQGLWIAIFLHTGRSVVTGATLSFHVHRHIV
jgi:hypothetical protein